MTYQTFKQQIRQSLQDAFGSDVSIILQDILKNNNTHLDGLTVLTPGCNISPTIYLNDYFHAYENGRPISDICTEIRDIYQQNKPAHSVDISFFTCYEKVQSRIIFKLINYERNKALLTDVPHFRFLDLAIVFNCLIGIDPDDISQSFSEEKISCSPSASGSSTTILIHNHHLSFWNITKDDLYALACKNTPDLQHYELRNMSDVLKELLSDDDSSAILAPPAPFPMYVLSNHTKLNGSACILYQDLLKNFAEHLRSDLYILPSRHPRSSHHSRQFFCHTGRSSAILRKQSRRYPSAVLSGTLGNGSGSQCHTAFHRGYSLRPCILLFKGKQPYYHVNYFSKK